jgi:uncharacterized protein
VQAIRTTPEVREAIERFRESVRSRFGGRLRQITLFGSQARGDAHADSDVDLLVVVDALPSKSGARCST